MLLPCCACCAGQATPQIEFVMGQLRELGVVLVPVEPLVHQSQSGSTACHRVRLRSTVHHTAARLLMAVITQSLGRASHCHARITNS